MNEVSNALPSQQPLKANTESGEIPPRDHSANDRNTGGATDSTDTVDLGVGKHPPKPLPIPEELDDFLAHLDDATPVLTSDPIEAQDVRARYIIGDEIGSGAIGQVIEAWDEHLGRRVAIKILHGGPGVSKDRLARFIAEAQITGQLEHPCIVPVHEIGRMPGGMPYFSMKYVKGESLDDIINNLRIGDEEYKKRYTGKHIIRMFFRLCQGIAYAHHWGVLHRDLKPGNILIGEYGEVKVMDWGLAKIMSQHEMPTGESVRTVRDAPDLGTLDGAIAGTPAYMSPEQARGEGTKIGPASDVYSLGLILAELLSLVRVFRGQDSRETMDQVKRSGPVDPTVLNPNIKIPPELVAIVRKCTAPAPDERYPSAEELAEDVRKYLEDREIEIAPDMSHRKVMKWSRRNPMLAGALIAVVAMAFLQAAWNLMRHYVL